MYFFPPHMHSLPHHLHHSPECYIHYNLRIHINMSVLPKIGLQWHPLSILYVPGVWTNVCHAPTISFIQNSPTALRLFIKVFCLLIPPPSTPSIHWHFYCLHSFAFSRMSYSWSHTVYSLFRLASFTQYMHLKPFHGLITHYYLARSAIPLSACTTVYVFIHPLWISRTCWLLPSFGNSE